MLTGTQLSIALLHVLDEQTLDGAIYHIAITVVEVLSGRDTFFTLAAILCNTSLMETTLGVGPKHKKKTPKIAGRELSL